MIEERNILYEEPFSYVQNKKLILSQLIHSNSEVIITPSKINFAEYTNISVTIVNIKTREEYNCPFKVFNNSLKINLLPLIYLFTDYEGSLNITLNKNNTSFQFTPLISKINLYESKDNKKHNASFKWFIRLLDNGEIRFSSIINNKNL